MICKIDLVMWTKNGSKTLKPVLKQIGQVIPQEFVNKRIIVDDKSTDDTREIAKSYGWAVIFNEGKGISDGANTALKHVETDYFISFEQDLLLAPDWWRKIPKYLSDKNVAVASGVRFAYYPPALKKIQEFATEKYRCEDNMGQFFPYVKTLDNTIYKTKIMRSIGGFPDFPISAGVDHILVKQVYSFGYRWKVDYRVKSVHLRSGLKDEWAHNYWYGSCSDELENKLFNRYLNSRTLIFRVLLSPVRGLQMAIRLKEPQIVYFYPLLRLAFLKGLLDCRKKSGSSHFLF